RLRSALGLCQAPRTSRPGTTTRTRFSALLFSRPTRPQATPSVAAKAPPATRQTTLARIARRMAARLRWTRHPGLMGHSRAADCSGGPAGRNPKFSGRPGRQVRQAVDVRDKAPGVARRGAVPETDQGRLEGRQASRRPPVQDRVDAEDPLG